jgi:hypothetical protein
LSSFDILRAAEIVVAVALPVGVDRVAAGLDDRLRVVAAALPAFYAFGDFMMPGFVAARRRVTLAFGHA